MEDKDEDVLIVENALDSEVAPFPDILAEMPGVEMEEQLTSPIAEPEMARGQEFETRAEAAARNANFGRREAAILGQDMAPDEAD